MKLGLFGGAFDPVHHGHLVLAQDFLESLELDAVIWIPTSAAPTHGRSPIVATARQRLKMLRAALRGRPRFWLSTLHVFHQGPLYTIDMVRHFQKSFPQARLYWLVGADYLPRLHTWVDFQDLRTRVTFVVAAREA